MSWPTAHAAVIDAADAALVEPEPTAVLGSTRPAGVGPAGNMTGSPAGGTRIDRWDTGFVDLVGVQGLLGQVTGPTKASVVDWITARTPQLRAVNFEEPV